MTLRNSQTRGCSKRQFQPVDAEAISRHPPTRLFNPFPWPHDPAKGGPMGLRTGSRARRQPGPSRAAPRGKAITGVTARAARILASHISRARRHQGIGQPVPFGLATSASGGGEVVAVRLLSGPYRDYRRATREHGGDARRPPDGRLPGRSWTMSRLPNRISTAPMAVASDGAIFPNLGAPDLLQVREELDHSHQLPQLPCPPRF
jgi:hypothetical protein